MEKTVIRDGWDIIKALADPEVAELLGATPQFRDDKELLPLQAADMLAWWIRAMASESIAGVPMNYRPTWKSKRQIPGIQIHFDEERLKRAIENTNQKMGFRFS